MHQFLAVFDSSGPVLLCLASGGGCLWQATRAGTAFQPASRLLALLLLVHPPVLLLLHFSTERDALLPFALTLFCLSLLALGALGSAFALTLNEPPPYWRPLTGGLLVLATTIATSWPYLPPATPELPGWLTALFVVGVEAGLVGLVLYWGWVWPARGLSQRQWCADLPGSPAWLLVRQAHELQAAPRPPTPAEFRAWLRMLPPPARRIARQAGAELLWSKPLFRRFLLEARGGHRYVNFMAEHLSAAQFVCWVDAVYAGQ